jgi:hypothetical protein
MLCCFKTLVHLLKSPPPMMCDPILDVMNGFSAKIGPIVPLGRGFSSSSQALRAVPPGQNTLERRGFTLASVYGLKPWVKFLMPFGFG